MRGSIRSRGKRSWQIQVYTDTGADSKPHRYFETIRGRKADAQTRLNQLLVSLDKGVYTPPGRMTVAQHLESWLSGYVRTNCSPRTLDGYRSIISHHLAPAFGNLPLKQLRPAVIQSYYGKACACLSNRTVHHQHRVLSESLKYALRQGYLGRNPCDLVDPPSPRKKAMRTLTSAEVESLMRVAQDSFYYPLIYTAVSSGLRQAELLGLTWRAIDLDMCSISVTQTLYKRGGICTFKQPKTAHSSRRVAMTPKLALFLRDYKANQEVLCLELGKVLALDDLVFISYRGEPLNPSVVTHNFQRIAAKAGITGVRFHDLRHTFASLMLLRGAKPKVISEALGHASVAFTMDVYSPIIEGVQEDAMALLDEVLPAGVSKKHNANLTPD
ncbi:MAG: site-specific integrase [Chloroflexi bacterium]|nr:site-specific integrase [Chloroflexota bacterium]